MQLQTTATASCTNGNVMRLRMKIRMTKTNNSFIDSELTSRSLATRLPVHGQLWHYLAFAYFLGDICLDCRTAQAYGDICSCQ